MESTRVQVPKEHCLDAACVGLVDALEHWQQPVLVIKTMGRGSYQRTRLTKDGYLTRNKSVFGFQTGDMVKAIVTTGKKAGTHLGRVAIRASGSFNIQTGNADPRNLASFLHARSAGGRLWIWVESLRTERGKRCGNPALKDGVSAPRLSDEHRTTSTTDHLAGH